MLKSGGHPLTVVDVKDDHVECLWMGVDGDLYRESLPVVALESTELDPEDDEEEDEDEEGDEDEYDDEDEDDEGDRKKKRKAA
ncbi:DUF2158 domain-containing protein [Bradyrhizobium jicamae]|uniref:DUF2158 domain-containing protein n=1 Tax=Bradyrhizobium jicamae TaxID=280332 RepID=UPI002011DDD3|nr:DUF2158 domain-containing protein [Bradyrhizobium jicamae]